MILAKKPSQSHDMQSTVIYSPCCQWWCPIIISTLAFPWPSHHETVRVLAHQCHQCDVSGGSLWRLKHTRAENPKNSASGRLWRFFAKMEQSVKMKTITLARKKTCWEEDTLKDTNAQHMTDSDCLWSWFYLLNTFYQNKMSTRHSITTVYTLMQGKMFKSRYLNSSKTFNEAVAIPPIICFIGMGAVRNHGGFVIWDAKT